MTEPGELNKPLLQAADDAPSPPLAPRWHRSRSRRSPEAPTQPTAAPARRRSSGPARRARLRTRARPPLPARRFLPTRRTPVRTLRQRRPARRRPVPLAPRARRRRRHRDGARRWRVARQRQPRRIALLERLEHDRPERHSRQQPVRRVLDQPSRTTAPTSRVSPARCSPVSSTSRPRCTEVADREPAPAW